VPDKPKRTPNRARATLAEIMAESQWLKQKSADIAKRLAALDEKIHAMDKAHGHRRKRS
jgi:hypothetical protein